MALLFDVSLLTRHHFLALHSAGMAQWLIGTGRAPASYIASQGTAMGRQGRVVVKRDDSDLSMDAAKRNVWIGGHSVVCIRGTVQV